MYILLNFYKAELRGNFNIDTKFSGTFMENKSIFIYIERKERGSHIR